MQRTEIMIWSGLHQKWRKAVVLMALLTAFIKRLTTLINKPSHKGPFTGEGHVGLYEILTTSWHAQLAINLAMFGSLSIIVAHHMYAMPPYPYLATDYGTQLSLFTHHMWIGGFCIVGAGAHAAIFMIRDYDPANSYNNLLDRVIRHRDAIISHLNWVCIFLGFHSFGLYIHNDTMSALGRPQDMFSDTAIQLQPVFAQWIQNTHFLAPQFTAPNALAATSLTWGGDLVAVGGKVAMMPISLGTSDFLVWLMLDQVKLRYMLEPLVLIYGIMHIIYRKVCNLTVTYEPCSHCLNNQLDQTDQMTRSSWAPSCLDSLPFAPLRGARSPFNLVPQQQARASYPPTGGYNNTIPRLLGAMENILDRVNQQVTTFFSKQNKPQQKRTSKTQIGTSETTREAVSHVSNFNFND